MELKKRQEWRENQSIVDARSEAERGQIIWKGTNGKGKNVFLVRIGKDASRQVTGSVEKAERALVTMETELRLGA